MKTSGAAKEKRKLENKVNAGNRPGTYNGVSVIVLAEHRATADIKIRGVHKNVPIGQISYPPNKATAVA